VVAGWISVYILSDLVKYSFAKNMANRCFDEKVTMVANLGNYAISVP
jgi:hypothetical protein